MATKKTAKVLGADNPTTVAEQIAALDQQIRALVGQRIQAQGEAKIALIGQIAALVAQKTALEATLHP